MSVAKLLSQVTGGQISSAAETGHKLNELASVMRCEIILSGLITDISTSVQISEDGLDWIEVATAAAGVGYVAVDTSAPLLRVVTSGTVGPYDVDLIKGKYGN